MNKGHKYRLPLRSGNKVETGLIFMGKDHDIRDRHMFPCECMLCTLTALNFQGLWNNTRGQLMRLVFVQI
jgi:hypothetical protein